MKIARATPIRLSQAVLATAVALALSGPLQAADPEPTSGNEANHRAATTELKPTDSGTYDKHDDGGELTRLDPIEENFEDDFDDETSADRTAANDRKPADNSIHNERDKDGATLTPLDQSSAMADVELTRSIREQLVDDDSLGTNAQNVKVITIDGMVTLRGTVATDEEHARVVAIAHDTAGADRVVDELEVIEDESYTHNSKGE
jgi:hypothetical protein